MNTDKRPSPEVIEALYELGVDAVTTTMDGLGVRRTFMQGPQIRIPGSKIVGPAITLRFVPNREDKIKGFKLPGADGEGIAEEEEAEKKSALWEIMYHVQPGDVLVAEQRGDIATGVVGEMLATYFKARGGIGIVTDGCVRDSKMIFEEVGLPCWTTSLTTGGASHMNLFPLDFNLPIGCGKVLVEPGDIIMADNGGRDRGAACTPACDSGEGRRKRGAGDLHPDEAAGRGRDEEVLPPERRRTEGV